MRVEGETVWWILYEESRVNIVSCSISCRKVISETVSGEVCVRFWKTSFTQRLVGHWNWMPWKVITAPSLTELTECLGNVLGHMVWLLGGHVQGVELQWSLWVPSNSGYSMILLSSLHPMTVWLYHRRIPN